MTLVALLFQAIEIYTWMIIIWVITSWIPNAREYRIVKVLGRMTEPYLRIFRFIPPLGGLDLSPLVGIVALMVGKRLLLHLLV